MKKFVCSVCGYVHVGDEAPEFCPICKAPRDKFYEQTEETGYATEHVIGVGAADKIEKMFTKVWLLILTENAVKLVCIWQ